jgi:hypothetical protein
VSNDGLWTQQETAGYLRVSIRYLRSSNCPRITLPSAGGSRPLLRYDPDAVKQWAEKRMSRAS